MSREELRLGTRPRGQPTGIFQVEYQYNFERKSQQSVSKIYSLINRLQGSQNNSNDESIIHTHQQALQELLGAFQRHIGQEQ